MRLAGPDHALQLRAEVQGTGAMLGWAKKAGVFLWQVVNDFMSDRCPPMAAGISYYTVFSLPPLLVLLLLLLQSLLDTANVERLLAAQFGEVIGPEGAEQVEALIESAAKPELGGIAIVGVIAFLFGATGAFFHLQASLNIAWKVGPDPTRGEFGNFLLKRLTSLAMVLALGFLLLVSLVVSAALSAVGAAIGPRLPGDVSQFLFRFTRGSISFVGVALVFAAIFRYIPDAVVRWRDVLVGGAFTSLLFSVGKFVIGRYIGRSDPAGVFGAAASLAVVLIWIFYMANIVLFGAMFTKHWARTRSVPIVPKPGAVRVVRTWERQGG